MRSGFVGTVGPSPARAAGQTGASSETDGHERVLLAADWCWLAARTRAGERLSVARHPSGATVAVLGELVDTSTPLATAEDLFSRLRADGAGVELDPAGFEGSYQVLVIDASRRTIRLINDHLASRPLFHGEDGGRFGFGRSEAEVTRLLGRASRLSFEGAAGFLAVGYPLGSLTLIEGVRRLRPARDLLVNADGMARERAWWDLSFGDPAPRRLHEAVEELHDLTRVSLGDALADGGPFHLALTGGLDSRLLLALLREVGKRPETAFTWYHRPDVNGSDPEVARALAAIAGVPHRTLRYAPDAFALHLDDWLRASALGSDNLGHFCAGETFLADHGLPPHPVLLGDHALGLGGSFATDADAIAGVLRTPWPALSPALRALLAPEAVERLREAVVGQVEAISAATDATRPKDLHHYLYFHVGVFGWLLAPGYYKEPVMPARRPLASRALLEAASRWPAELRLDKRVVVSLLRERFADLHAVPTADRSALVDWRAAVRDVASVGDALGGMLAEAVRDGRLLARDLRRDAVADRLAALRRAAPATRDQRLVRAWGVRLRRAVGHLRLAAGPLQRLERLMRRAAGRDGGPDDDLRYLFRVGLLAAYERQLADDTGRPTAPGATEGAGV